MMSLNAVRSIESTMALRICGLSKGGLSRLTSRLACVLVGNISHCAHGAWLLMSFRIGTVISPVKVRSTLRAMKAGVDVGRLEMIVYSMPSRYGRPFFQ